MKGYNSYKDSGVEWIGVIPENWDNVRLKLISSITKGRKPNKDYEDNLDGFLPYLSMEYLRDKTDEPVYADANEKNIVLVDEGDILILWDGSKAGEIVRAKKGILSSTMAKIEIYDNRFESNFLNYLLQLGEKHIQANTIGMGIPHVNGNILKDLMMLLPTVAEQTAIASFLDYKTNLIDATIEKKKRLIALLKEKRQAVINEAVTKGLNPEATMKDSGVEWLGEIPEHWKITKIKLLSSVISKGTTPSTEGRGLADEGIRYLKAENIKETQVSFFPEFFIDDETHEILKRSQLEENDILFVIAGATIGKVAILPKEMTPANTNQAVCFIRLKQNENHKFLHFWLQSSKIYEQIWLNAVQSAQPNLSMEELGNFIVPYPSLVEQTEIVNFIDITTSKIDDLIDKNKLQIEKLQTYRQSLISEAVTGKIDVRDWEREKN